jgi:uncharacterized protein
MELTNEFTVDVPVDRAWMVLTDLELIAPCLPGAELREVDGEEYRGVVKIKVGPIATAYQGTARFIELDQGAGHIVLKAEGREARGQGNANAVVTATLRPTGSRTTVTVVTTLAITGKVAQFGRGVLADVSAKLLDQFAKNLETTVLSQDAVTLAAPTPVGADVDGQPQAMPARQPNSKEPADWSGVRLIHSAAAEPVDVVELAGGSVLRRFAPLVSVVVVAIAITVWLARRR